MSDDHQPARSRSLALDDMQPALKLAIIGLMAAGVLGLGLVPDLHHPLGDKTEHVVAFALLALAFRRSGTRLAAIPVTFTVLVAIAIVLELLQGALLRSRIASESDALASVIGVIAGIALSWLRGWKLAGGLFAVLLLGLCVNWGLNVGRYKVQDRLFSHAAEAPANPA